MLIQNPPGARLAPLGKLRNMQIKSAITKISFLGHNLFICPGMIEIVMSTPGFRGSLNLIIPIPTSSTHLHMHNMQIRQPLHKFLTKTISRLFDKVNG